MTDLPRIARVGMRGVLVTFGDVLSDTANLAAIAFRSKVDAMKWPEVTETASTLVSTFIAVDLTQVDYADIASRLQDLLAAEDWERATPPAGRKLWTIPMCFDPEVAPQLDDAAFEAGVSFAEARKQLEGAQTRVITLGFAPGQPYLGMLSETWDIPRQTELTPQVPIGALVLAIRQFVLFATSAPTGWRHVGQTAFKPFDPIRETPVAFTPGDEIRFAPITVPELRELENGNTLGGADWVALP